MSRAGKPENSTPDGIEPLIREQYRELAEAWRAHAVDGQLNSLAVFRDRAAEFSRHAPAASLERVAELALRL
ncbi:MAG: hypothetical protein LAT50_20210, partial [Ectothiorhodospiraceae bacterium]|nr:hypothetical protein [Ectothiorhodospiraceae bacterium]